MMITVTVSKTLDDFWADEATLANLTDGEILALVQEDLVAFVDGACWTVDREDDLPFAFRPSTVRRFLCDPVTGERVEVTTHED